MIQVLRSTRKYEFVSQKASCRPVALSAHMGLSLFQAHSILLSVVCQFYFISLLIHLFLLFVTIRDYPSLFAFICHYQPLLIRHYSPLFVTIRDYSVVIRVLSLAEAKRPKVKTIYARRRMNQLLICNIKKCCIKMDHYGISKHYNLKNYQSKLHISEYTKQYIQYRRIYLPSL